MMRTAQELFDTVVTHLRTQKQKSFVPLSETPDGQIVEYQCRYRAGQEACAIGCLIPMDVYSVKMEGTALTGLLVSNLLPTDLQLEFDRHYSMLRALQNVHDFSPIDTWEKQFGLIAIDFKLKLSSKL